MSQSACTASRGLIVKLMHDSVLHVFDALWNNLYQ